MGYHLKLANTQRNRDNSASFGSKGGISSTDCINVTCERENTGRICKIYKLFQKRLRLKISDILSEGKLE